MPASIQELLDTLPQTGVLTWIRIRPARVVSEGTMTVGDAVTLS